MTFIYIVLFENTLMRYKITFMMHESVLPSRHGHRHRLRLCGLFLKLGQVLSASVTGNGDNTRDLFDGQIFTNARTWIQFVIVKSTGISYIQMLYSTHYSLYHTFHLQRNLSLFVVVNADLLVQTH